jgi:hypothetical protein
MTHAANREKIPQINAHSPRDSSSTKIGPPSSLGDGLGPRPELSGRDGLCRPFQETESQFHCEVGFLSTWSSTLEEPANPSRHPDLLRCYFT